MDTYDRGNRIGLLQRDGFEFCSKVPRQEFGDATDRVVGDALLLDGYKLAAEKIGGRQRRP